MSTPIILLKSLNKIMKKHWSEKEIYLKNKPREMTKEELKKWIEKEKKDYFLNSGYLS